MGYGQVASATNGIDPAMKLISGAFEFSHDLETIFYVQWSLTEKSVLIVEFFRGNPVRKVVVQTPNRTCKFSAKDAESMVIRWRSGGAGRPEANE